MTKSQEKTIERIKESIPKFDYYGHQDDYEIKEWTVTETDYGIVILVFETGRKGDEGTYASIFCRKRRQLFIGKRGGVSCYKESKLIKGFFNCMNRGYYH